MHLNGGDYLVPQRENDRFTVDLPLSGAALAATKEVSVRNANFQIFVQKVVISHITHVAGKTVEVQDDAATPVPILVHNDYAAAAGVPDIVTFDFGPIGTPLTLGQNLMVLANTGGTGFVALVHIEGYQKLATTVGSNAGASLQ